jgi:hypothetical protein
MRRRIIVITAVVLTLAAGFGVAWYAAIRRADDYINEVRNQKVPEPREIAVELAPAVTFSGARAGVAWATSVDEVRDGGALRGTTFVATSGGLLPIRAGQRASARPYTRLDGLAGVDLTAVAPLGSHLVVGDATGGLTLIDGERAVAATLKLKRPGAIADLAPAGDTVYALVTGGGVLSFDGKKAIDVAAATATDLAKASAICTGDAGLAIGTSDGKLFREQSGTLSPIAAAGIGEGPITALSCEGDALLAGTPFGLFRVAEGQARALAHDLFVTSIQATPGTLFVASFDDGVRLLDPESGRLRAHLRAGQRITRLRTLDGKLLAFGPGGPFVYTGGELADFAAPASPGLAGPHVTALARDGGGVLWVGTFEHGIDLLDGDLVPTRHLPARQKPIDARDDQVDALLYRPETRTMLAATVHGVDRYDDAGVQRMELEGVEDAAAIAPSKSGLAIGHHKGLTLVDGSKVRTIYAFHGLANNHVYAVASDGNRLYAGTLGGLSILEDGKVTRSYGTGPHGLRAAWVTALAVADEGVFVGSYGGGVQLVHRDGTVEDVSAGLGTIHVDPGALALFGNGLLVGTLEAGLLEFDRTTHKWRRLDPKARLLPSESVTALLPDGDALLVGTTAGLARIPRALLDASFAPFHPEGST